jgi:uncharacterized protein
MFNNRTLPPVPLCRGTMTFGPGVPGALELRTHVALPEGWRGAHRTNPRRVRDVAHVIHRHGLTEDQAVEVEAALIDAYPAVTNEVGGEESDERGLMHSRQIVEQYEAPEAAIKHKAVLITVNRTVTERESVYAAVRYAWKLDPVRAQRAEVVLAQKQGMIVGVYLAERWMPATVANFPDTLEDRPGR